MDIPDLTPLQWALVVVLLLLAMAGIYHIGARLAGYKVLPMYQPSACGGPPHQLAYITEKERIDLIEAGGLGEARFGTQGVPCYPVHGRDYSTPPPSPKRRRTDEAPAFSIPLAKGGDPHPHAPHLQNLHDNVDERDAAERVSENRHSNPQAYANLNSGVGLRGRNVF